MSKKEPKNYGCFAIILILIGLYILLSIYVKVTDFIGEILSIPLVNYGIPIVIILIIYLANRKEEKDKEK